MTTATPARDASLDALRVLGVFGVVAIHAANARLSDPLTFVFDELGRFAVPMFFVLSGYFWRAEDIAHPLRLTLRSARRVIPGFVAFYALTTLLVQLKGPAVTFDLSPASLFLMVWAGDPVAHYLWFLPALVVGTAIAATLVSRFGLGPALLLTGAAYGIGCAIGAYGELVLYRDQAIWLYRNGILFAPLFLIAGVALRRHRELSDRLPLPLLVASACAFALLQIVEGWFILGRSTFGHDYGIATAPYALTMVLLFMRLPISGAFWASLGRASFGAYLIHYPLLILATAWWLPQLPLPLLIVACATTSIALATAYRAFAVRPANPSAAANGAKS